MGVLQGLPPGVVPGQSFQSKSFTGTGRLLSGETVPSAPQSPQDEVHNVQLRNNGFTVDDGPLRSFADPQNADFMEEPYRAPGPFQGVGRTLGGGSSAGERSSSAPAVQESRSAPGSIGFIVDDSLPYTSIQLRLADGTRMVVRFNMHHTVGDIRSFVDASRPGAGRACQWQTGFPPKQLTDLTQTVEQAGLANSVIFQKL